MPDFSNPFAQAILKQFLGKQYGGFSGEAVNQYNQIAGTKTGSSLSNLPYLQSTFKGMAENGMPNLANYRQNAQTQIGQQYQKSSTALSEALAQSGMLRSGAGVNARLGLDASRMQATAGVEQNLMQMNEKYKMNALAQLLGLDQMSLQEAGLNQNFLLALMGQAGTTDTRAQQNERDTAFGTGLGNIVGKGLSLLPFIL